MCFCLRGAFCLYACGVGLSLICLRGAFSLHAYGVGLSLHCYRSISVAPVRGGTYFSLPPQREVGKRKRLEAPAKRVPRTVAVVVHLESVSSHTPRW